MTFSLSSSRPHGSRQTRSVPSVRAMVNVRQERRQLARMDSARLRDLGISAQDAATEAARPFWDLP